MSDQCINIAVHRIADIYGASTRFWRREVWAGRLPHVRLGKRVYVPRDALEAYMASRAHPVREGSQAGDPFAF